MRKEGGLKVAELRSRLNQAGLDSRGLKVELVERLWSLLDNNGGQRGNIHEQDVQRQGNSDKSTTVLFCEYAEEHCISVLYSGSVHILFPPPPPPSLKTSAPPVPGITETPETVVASTSSSLLLSTSHAEPASGTPPCGPADRTREFSDSSTQTEAEGIPRCPLPNVDDCQAEKIELEPAEEVRGRAFYEFKEEIRYKREKRKMKIHSNCIHVGIYMNAIYTHCFYDKIASFILFHFHIDDSHLHFQVGPDGACGQPRFWDRFPLLWSGCRLTHGVSQGRVGFEAANDIPILKHFFFLSSGEDALSFAYDGRARKVTCGREEEFGEPFCEGDIIGCYASFSTDGGVQLSFHKNGRFLGVAFSLEASELGGRALFPHVICKSCAVRFLLDPTAPPWYPVPPGFTTLVALPAMLRHRNASAPSSRAQSEVLLMVGLPGSGKSHWAKAHIQQHPEKNYKLLGTEELLSCMMVSLKPSRGTPITSLLQVTQTSQCLTELIKMAAHTPGNYILDQCNTLFSAQRYKLQLFSGFGRRAAVVLFPSADEWKRRLSERQKDGENIPETALLKHQVSCSLPEQLGDVLDELRYVELEQDVAQTLLREYKDEARRLLPPVTKPEKPKKYLLKKRPHEHGPPLPPHWIRGSGMKSTYEKLYIYNSLILSDDSEQLRTQRQKEHFHYARSRDKNS
uniref:SAP domain-containing protein n=1 Tax=Hippocampus comes TaxID=109280 RepID=A0A3Q3ECR1_HIPCM